jgi:surface protein
VSITGTGQGFQFNNGGDRAKLFDIGQWGSISGSVNSAFYGCFNLVGTAADPHILQTTDLVQYFRGNSRFNGYVGNWNTANVTNMQSVFFEANLFNGDISKWNTSKVTVMQSMFRSFGTTVFNQDISQKVINSGLPNEYIAWDVSKVTIFNSTFSGATSFNKDINNWDV